MDSICPNRLLDANWISDFVNVKSTTYFVFLLGRAVFWKSTKQTVMAKSTMKSEIALDTTSIETKWLKDLLIEIS